MKNKSSTATESKTTKRLVKTLPADIVLKRIIRSIKENCEDADFLIDLCKDFYPIRDNRMVVGAHYEVGDKVVLELETIE